MPRIGAKNNSDMNKRALLIAMSAIAVYVSVITASWVQAYDTLTESISRQAHMASIETNERLSTLNFSINETVRAAISTSMQIDNNTGITQANLTRIIFPFASGIHLFDLNRADQGGGITTNQSNYVPPNTSRGCHLNLPVNRLKLSTTIIENGKSYILGCEVVSDGGSNRIIRVGILIPWDFFVPPEFRDSTDLPPKVVPRGS